MHLTMFLIVICYNLWRVSNTVVIYHVHLSVRVLWTTCTIRDELRVCTEYTYKICAIDENL